MADILTVDHHRWDEFAGILEGPDGCNFRKESPGKGKKEETRWDCGGGSDKSIAERILGDLGGFNIPRSLEYFDRHGGHCDCEILFNVVQLEPGQREDAVRSIAVKAGLKGPKCPACGNYLHGKMDFDNVANLVLDPDDEETHDIAVICLKQMSDADDAAVCGAEIAGYSTMADLRRQVEQHNGESEKAQQQLDALKTAIGRRAEHFGGGK